MHAVNGAAGKYPSYQQEENGEEGKKRKCAFHNAEPQLISAVSGCHRVPCIALQRRTKVNFFTILRRNLFSHDFFFFTSSTSATGLWLPAYSVYDYFK